jgi:hypothetical protein
MTREDIGELSAIKMTAQQMEIDERGITAMAGLVVYFRSSIGVW